MYYEKTELYKLIIKCREGDKESIKTFCNKFAPLIKRYSFYLGDEEAYNYLIIELLKCLKTMPLEEERFKNDKYILSYIKSTVNNSYNHFKKYLIGHRNNEVLTEDLLETTNELLEENTYDNLLLILDLKSILSDKEYLLFQLKYEQGFKDKEIAKMYDVTRQAINKRYKKLKLKLINYYNNL